MLKSIASPPVELAGPDLTVENIAAHSDLQTESDTHLMFRIRDDDASAFEEIVRRYQDRLVGVLATLVGNGQYAEDLAQDVFLRVFRARKSYQRQAKFSTWLFTIANNVASNARRGRSRRREVNLVPPDVGTGPLEKLARADSGQMPSRQLDQSERAEVVRQAVAGLSQRQRMAVLLAKFEGMSYAEIGETMELSPQAVKSLLARARTKLREDLEPYLAEGLVPASAEGTEKQR